MEHFAQFLNIYHASQLSLKRMFLFQWNHLGLDLFDTSFQLTNYPYTVDDHYRYLASLNIEDPVASSCLENSDVSSPTPSESKPAVSRTNIEVCLVYTRRPELVS